MRRILIILILLVTTTASAEAQVESGGRLTLEDAIARALEHNFDIRIANVTAEQAAANNTAGNAGLLPDVNATGGVNYGLANTRIEFADGRIQERNNAQTISYNAAVTASYTLFAAGRAWLIRKQLRANEELALVQVREQMQLIVSQVIQTYARVVWQKQQVVAIDTGLALAKVRMILSQVKFETGASAKVDYLQARVDYNARQSDSLQQISLLNSAFADLNFLMGTDPFLTWVTDDSLQIQLGLEPADKDRLRDLNLSLEVARRFADISDLNARISRTFMYPSLSANAGYNYSRTNSQAGFALFNQSSGPTVGLTMNAPIFQGGNLRREAKVATLQAFRDELLYERQTTEIGRQYRTAWKDYEMAVASYRLELENIEYARENMDIQKARFRVGIATTIETREAENSYIQALVRFYTAAYNVKVNETRVLELESRL